ncbi:hypothetical protein B484DRAFT_406883 [Ochromonadaceae sp. CCMP2298]|nr:hypothetical protein B484DRAFT_406883 [Ochromonadaceae sp. CCMP2298]
MLSGVLHHSSVLVMGTDAQQLQRMGFGARRLHGIEDVTPAFSAPASASASASASTSASTLASGTAGNLAPSVMHVDTPLEATVAVGGTGTLGHTCTASAPAPALVPLLLLDEEALYLLLRGALVVHTPSDSSGSSSSGSIGSSSSSDKQPDPTAKDVQEQQPLSFLAHYCTYAHFRDLGYVIRSGVNFGTDLCLYRTLPSLCHSEMCVTIVDARRGGGYAGVGGGIVGGGSRSRGGGGSGSEDGGCGGSGVLSWRSLGTLTRVIPDCAYSGRCIAGEASSSAGAETASHSQALTFCSTHTAEVCAQC